MSKIMALLGQMERAYASQYGTSRGLELPSSFISELIGAYRDEVVQAEQRKPTLVEDAEDALRTAIRKGESEHAATFYGLLQQMKKESNNG